MRRIAIIAALLFAQPAQADEEEDRKVVYSKATQIDFEGLDISAALTKPAGSLVLERKQASFNPLIKLRKDFNQEMDQSVQEIK